MHHVLQRPAACTLSGLRTSWPCKCHSIACGRRNGAGSGALTSDEPARPAESVFSTASCIRLSRTVRRADASPCHAQLDFGIVEENAGENKLHVRRVSQGMTIHVPQGEIRGLVEPDVIPAVVSAYDLHSTGPLASTKMHVFPPVCASSLRSQGKPTHTSVLMVCMPCCAAIVHFSHNPTCQPAQFLANFGERDPGATLICCLTLLGCGQIAFVQGNCRACDFAAGLMSMRRARLASHTRLAL